MEQSQDGLPLEPNAFRAAIRYDFAHKESSLADFVNTTLDHLLEPLDTPITRDALSKILECLRTCHALVVLVDCQQHKIPLIDDRCYTFRVRGSLGLFVSSADRARLAAIVADRNSPQKHVWRAAVVLLTGDRLGTAEIMRLTGLSKPSVWRWQQRCIKAGVDGLLRDKTRPSRIPKLANEKVAAVVRLTLDEDPPHDATHWTVRAMAERSGVSTAMVHRIRQENGLAPHRFRLELSNDPAFAAKVEDVVGLYIDPPQHAVVLSIDEKSQI